MRGRNFWLTVCRLLLAATFIFSGFVKSVDPWGTAIKISEYLEAFHMGWLVGAQFVLAIWLTGAELMLGLMLLFRVRMRMVTTFAALSMLFFTALTLVLAIWSPVEDCGCFGDAVKLTNWETFLKNLVLLPMSLVLWWNARHLKVFPFPRRDIVAMALIACVSGGIGIYSLYHLPLIDFLPYKVGANLAESEDDSSQGDVQTTLIYRDKLSGKLQEFTLSDTTWYDSERWEYVDTETTLPPSPTVVSRADFTLLRDGEFATEQVLDFVGEVYMVCANDLQDIKRRQRERLELAVAAALGRGAMVVCLTSSPLAQSPYVTLGAEQIPCYNMDATSLKTMLRAKVGVVVLRSGVVEQKYNWRDLPDK